MPQAMLIFIFMPILSLVLFAYAIDNFNLSIVSRNYLHNKSKMSLMTALVVGMQGILLVFMIGLYVDMYGLGGGFATFGAVFGAPYIFLTFAVPGYAFTRLLLYAMPQAILSKVSRLHCILALLGITLLCWLCGLLFLIIRHFILL